MMSSNATAFGHTKNHCQKLSNCVRYGLQHGLEACVKDVHPVNCVNCGGNHTSKQGCVVYQQVAYRRKSITSHRCTVHQQSTNSNVRSNFVGQNSYANAVRGQVSRPQHQQAPMTSLQSQQFPPLGSNNRKQRQLHHQVVPPRQQQQLSQQQQRPQHKQQQPCHQQQSFP